MMRWKRLFEGDDWKLVFAWLVVYAYAYNVIWPWIFWGTTVGTLATGVQWPAPPILPWEQLVAMTGNLLVIGGIQMMKDRRPTGSVTETESTKETVIVKGKGK